MSSNQKSFANIYQLNSAYVEDVFTKFQSNPDSVSAEWRAYFSGFFDGCKIGGQSGSTNIYGIQFELSVAKLVLAYKNFGHFNAHLNPLSPDVSEAHSLPSDEREEIFNPASYGLNQEDLSCETHAGILCGFSDARTVNQLITSLKSLFCSSVAVEFEHVANIKEREWLYSAFFNLQNDSINTDTQKHIYSELAKVDALEKTIATKYIGKKRFSIEGADAQVVAAESYMDELTALGAKEFRIGIAHRGRLNFLVNIIKKPLDQLFAEFEGNASENFVGDGDVKYHNGYESDRKTRSGTDIRIGLSFNPSHLEYVDPVVMGETRAIQNQYYNSDCSKIAPLLFHGDSAIAGQGIVYESAQLMSLRGYNVGGTVHVVANNQIGFTTNPLDARSGTYCTNVAYVTGSPVIHINTDDLEAVHKVMKLAARYRAEFKKDIYIDLICFRRFGHNEGDEPSFTQPVLYKLIKTKPAPYETYAKQLIDNKVFAADNLKAIYQDYRNEMTAVYEQVKKENTQIEQFTSSRAPSKLDIAFEKDILAPVDTKVSLKSLNAVAKKFLKYPESFKINPKIERLVIQERTAMLEGKKALDWGTAESLAYATLLEEGFSIRLTGEDTQRGTFSHRHAVIVDIETENEFCLFSNVNESKDVKVEIINTLLSEEATMGYEYGYATSSPDTLVIWEGQFGDFANGAQVIIDQFIAAGETKWRQQQGLVLLLPHGLEGQGSEHSSARLERFLQLCANGNMQVCYLTHANQIFHALRRQLKRNFRKPLIIMTPKSFLRSQRAATTVESLANSQFEEVIDDACIIAAHTVERILFCSGKIALDIFDALETEEYKEFNQKVAIVRIEQLYPLHTEQVKAIVKKYKKVKVLAWVQEEPKNMGAYSHIRENLASIVEEMTSNKLHYFGRSARATPAVGFEKKHISEQKKVIHAALTQKESAFI